MADMKRDYYEDVQLFESKVVLFWTASLVLALLLIPLFSPQYYIFLLNLIMVHVVIAVGLNILVGYTGQISLGHAGFFAIGAYGTALLMIKLSVPFFPAIIAAGFIAAFFGFILGLPALRLEGPYLAVASLGFGMAIMHIIGHWQFFGGRTGIQAPAAGHRVAGVWFQCPRRDRRAEILPHPVFHGHPGHCRAQYHEDEGGPVLCRHPGQRYRRGSDRDQPDGLQNDGLRRSAPFTRGLPAGCSGLCSASLIPLPST